MCVSQNLTYGPPRLREFLRCCLLQSASTYPALEQSSEPRWRSAQPGPHNLIDLGRAIKFYRFPSCRSTVRPSRFHHSQTSLALHDFDRENGHILTPQPANPQQRTSPVSAARPRRSEPICWPEPPQRYFCAPAQAGLSPSVRAACHGPRDMGAPNERHGSAAFEGICFLAC